MLIKDVHDPSKVILDFVCPYFSSQLEGTGTTNYFNQCVIFAPTNQEVDKIIEYILNKMSGDSKTHLCLKNVCNSMQYTSVIEALYSHDVLKLLIIVRNSQS